MWVKGSGGDLGTLTAAGLAVLRLDRLRALVDVYPGVDREDEMVAAFDFCLHGKGGAAPSIDTAMHGLLPAPHVDHLHPDSGIALAAAADGEKLTRQCFGDRVAWVPWRRPGFQLGLDIAAIAAASPQAIGVILGGHGITAWGATSAECEARSLEIIRTAAEFIEANGEAGPVRPGHRGLRAAARSRPARPRGRAGPADPGPGLDRPPAGRALHRLPRRAGLPGPGQAPGAGRARHLVPGSLPAHQGAADAARPAAGRLRSGGRGPAARAARGVPGGLPRLLRAVRGRRLAADARRGPGRSCWCPASACSASARTARPRGWRASST